MTDKVFEMIMDIRNSGACNMIDIAAVQRNAYEKGFFDLVIYIEEHKKEYIQFILTGERPKQD